MGVYYCKQCHCATLPETAATDGRHLFCKKCDIPLVNLGSEDSQISIQGHLESQIPTGATPTSHHPTPAKHYTMNKKDTVLIDCQAKLNENPRDIQALYTLAKWYYTHNNINAAGAIAKQVISLAPDFSPAHTLLSQLNTPKTNDTLPEDVKTLETMGRHYMTKNNLDYAMDIFKKILSINSKHTAAQRYLADIYTQKNQFNDAIHILNQLSLQRPDDPVILFNLAVACYNAGDIKRAKSNLNAAKQHSPSSDMLIEINQFISYLQNH
ncbi:MAG: tetratricopeptide repeat protein [Candidatus Marinamargulisbacteria bacterium]